MGALPLALPALARDTAGALMPGVPGCGSTSADSVASCESASSSLPLPFFAGAAASAAAASGLRLAPAAAGFFLETMPRSFFSASVASMKGCCSSGESES